MNLQQHALITNQTQLINQPNGVAVVAFCYLYVALLYVTDYI